ncbi:MAG: hypothetical protein C5B49_16000 [Bdellovibrio sp.]|nr:MAG: hypothetical protein C5B49_16000 [Bdellovibrio sp.]
MHSKKIVHSSTKLHQYVKYLPGLALLLIVAFQRFQVEFFDLSPPAGGGYGMFSTLDNPSFRFFRISTEVGGRQFVFDLGGALGSELARYSSWPSPKKVKEVFAWVRSRRWRLNTRGLKLESAATEDLKIPAGLAGLADTAAPADPAETVSPVFDLSGHPLKYELFRIRYQSEPALLYVVADSSHDMVMN